MRMAVDLRVLELLCARIAHDLVNPLGAVSNGLELLEEGDPAANAESIALCRDSMRRATALLQVFRSAYGTAGSQASFTPQAARDLADACLAGSKCVLQWPVGVEIPGRPGLGKLLLNLILVGSEALPRGGEIAVGLDGGRHALTLAVAATGAGARLTEEMAQALTLEVQPEALTTKSIQAYLTACLAERLGARLTAAPVSPDRVSFAVTLPQP